MSANCKCDNVTVRWMIRRDMPEILAIEEQCYEWQMWGDEDFMTCLRQRNCIGMVAERDERIVGYMIYELHKSSLHLVNFAVAPDHQRQGVGTAMVDRLVAKLTHQRRNAIRLCVSASNLGAQLFFKRMGFLATGILWGYYEDSDEDAYVMRYELEGRNQ